MSTSPGCDRAAPRGAQLGGERRGAGVGEHAHQILVEGAPVARRASKRSARGLPGSGWNAIGSRRARSGIRRAGASPRRRTAADRACRTSRSTTAAWTSWRGLACARRTGAPRAPRGRSGRRRSNVAEAAGGDRDALRARRRGRSAPRASPAEVAAARRRHIRKSAPISSLYASGAPIFAASGIGAAWGPVFCVAVVSMTSSPRSAPAATAPPDRRRTCVPRLPARA